MDKSEEKYPVLLEAYRNNGDSETVFDSLLERISEKELHHSTKALVFGSGPGIREIKFFKRLVPKLEKATFVESNEDCVEALRKNWNSSFGNKVSEQIHQCKMEDFQNNGKRYDVILILDCLYGVEEGQRRELLRRCMDEWLNPGGLLYISLVDNEYQGKTDTDIFFKVFKKLNAGNIIDINSIKADLVTIGKQAYNEYPYTSIKGVGSISNDFIGFFSYYCKPKKSDDEIREAIEAVVMEGGVYTCNRLIVLRNA